MNSGVRLSVAIIILVIVLVGLYYASLDDGTEQQVASAPAGTTESVIDPVEPAPIQDEPAAAGEMESVVLTEVPVDPDPTSDAQASDGDDPAAWEPADEIAETTEESALEPGDLGDPEDATEEFAEFDVELAIQEPLEPGAATEPVDSELPTDVANETTAEEASSEGTEAVPEEASNTVTDDRQPALESTPSASIAPRRAGRSATSPGVGMHRLPVEADLSSAEREAAAARLADAQEPEAGSIVAGEFLTWVPLNEGTSLGTAGAEAISGTGPDGGTWVLVREDLDGSLGLNGRISSAELNTVPSTDTYNILVRIDSADVETVVDRSRMLRTHPVAWVMDGRILRITRPRTVINGRGNIPLATDEATAKQVAARLMLPPGGAAVAPAATTTATTPQPAREGRPAGPGELPAAEYTQYTIEPGDTPSGIAVWWFGDANKVSLVLKANPELDPTRMQVGDVIRLPPKDYELWTVIATPEEGQRRVHIVQSGETLSHIAQAAYGTASRWPEIYEANRALIGDDPTKLRLGMELLIP